MREDIKFEVEDQHVAVGPEMHISEQVTPIEQQVNGNNHDTLNLRAYDVSMQVSLNGSSSQKRAASNAEENSEKKAL